MSENEKNRVLFYPPAAEKMSDIWVYSSQWGEDHADRYTEALYEAINKQHEHGLFPKAKTVDISQEKIYFPQWKYKSHAPVHTVFYRILSDSSIGVIEITGPRQDRDNRLRDALKVVQPLIE